MEINKELENKLWNVSGENHLDKETYDQIIDYLLARLSDYLQARLKLDGDNWLNGDSFSTEFHGIVEPSEVFRISYVGTLGMQVIDEELGPHISAEVV